MSDTPLEGEGPPASRLGESPAAGTGDDDTSDSSDSSDSSDDSSDNSDDADEQ